MKLNKLTSVYEDMMLYKYYFTLWWTMQKIRQSIMNRITTNELRLAELTDTSNWEGLVEAAWLQLTIVRDIRMLLSLQS